jgi:hypothetical protein
MLLAGALGFAVLWSMAVIALRVRKGAWVSHATLLPLKHVLCSSLVSHTHTKKTGGWQSIVAPQALVYSVCIKPPTRPAASLPASKVKKASISFISISSLPVFQASTRT